MKTKTLPCREDLANLLDYDPSSGAFRWKINIGTAKAGDVAGCLNARGYRKIRVRGIDCYAHRLAMYMHGVDVDGVVIDHINGNLSDNRLSNLRVCTQSINIHNSGLFSSNTSGVKGVGLDRGRWRAYLQNEGKMKSLGRFDTKAEAAAARDRAYNDIVAPLLSTTTT